MYISHKEIIFRIYTKKRGKIVVYILTFSVLEMIRV